MLRVLRPLCLITLAFAAATAPAQSPWNGTWKLNPAKSHMVGDTFTLSKSGDRYHFDAGSVQYDYACDGKEYPTLGGETVSCKETPNTVDSTYKQKGKITQTTKHVLDPDGKTYTSTSTDMLPSGRTTVTKTTFTRVGSGTGFAGTWQSSSTSTNHIGTFTIARTGDSERFESPEERVTWEGKLDGTPAPVHGPTAPDGLYYSEKAEGPNKTISEVTIGGKVVEHAEQTLSADGRSFSEISWDPSKPNEKQTYVFDKQ